MRTIVSRNWWLPGLAVGVLMLVQPDPYPGQQQGEVAIHPGLDTSNRVEFILKNNDSFTYYQFRLTLNDRYAVEYDSLPPGYQVWPQFRQLYTPKGAEQFRYAHAPIRRITLSAYNAKGELGLVVFEK